MTAQSWIERQAQTLMGSLGHIVATPVASAMTMAVIGIALVVPLLLSVILANVRAATISWNEAMDLSVYLDLRAGAGRAEALAKELRSRSDVRAVRVVTADQALRQFRAVSGFGDALDALSDNPLPDTLIVAPVLMGAPGDVAVLKKAIAAMADVQTVQVDTEWVMRFRAMVDIVRRVGWLIGTLLAVGVILVIGNTIRLDILNRRAEIEVMKLVGATDAFTRRPFLYAGMWYGLGGGMLAVALCAGVIQALALPVGHLAGLYGSQFRLQGLGLFKGSGVLMSSSALGWLGSWLAATRHIRGIAPT